MADVGYSVRPAGFIEAQNTTTTTQRRGAFTHPKCANYGGMPWSISCLANAADATKGVVYSGRGSTLIQPVISGSLPGMNNGTFIVAGSYVYRATTSRVYRFIPGAYTDSVVYLNVSDSTFLRPSGVPSDYTLSISGVLYAQDNQQPYLAISYQKYISAAYHTYYAFFAIGSFTDTSVISHSFVSSEQISGTGFVTGTGGAFFWNGGNPVFVHNISSVTHNSKMCVRMTLRYFSTLTGRYIYFPYADTSAFVTPALDDNTTCCTGDYLYSWTPYSSGVPFTIARIPLSEIPLIDSGTDVFVSDTSLAFAQMPLSVLYGSFPSSPSIEVVPCNGGAYVIKCSASATNISSGTQLPVTYVSFATMPPTPPEPSDDPYQEEGGISDYGGGGGGIDMDTSDDVDFPTLPQNLIADCGLVSFYNPTKAEIMQLADQILSQSIGGAIKNFFTDPLDGIVSLSLANVTPPLSGTRGEIKVGLIGTGVTANLLSSSYMELDCGTIQVGDKTKGNALDFTPYTKAELYLPFIGTVSVSPDDFMYSSVNIKYNIDLLSGTCVANVRIAKDGKNDILYSMDGNVLSQVPLSGKSYTELIKALSSIGAALVLGGGAGAAVAGVAGATLTNSKPAITRSGRMSLASGVLSPKKPYLIFSRPKQSLPEKFKSYKGYPSNVTTKLSEIIGFTQVKEIHIEGIAATSEELTMIEDLLKEGVII